MTPMEDMRDGPTQQPAANYCSPQAWERERHGAFADNWVFAGFRQDLAQPNDYLSFTIGGLPVIVRNMKGRLVAFRNVCSHRHSIIHPFGRGNDKFRCCFHGWTYDADGVPIGIPHNAKSFGFDLDGKKELALEQFAVDSCGNFVFVRIAKEGPALDEWLGAFAAPLGQISTVFDDIYARLDQSWTCNWKTPMDTMLVYRDYPEARGMAAPGVAVGESRLEKQGRHIAIHAPLPSGTRRHLESCARRLKLRRNPTLSGYDRFFIYPNLAISTDYGINALIARYEPAGAATTRFESWLLTGQPERPGLRGGPVWKAVTEHWEQFARAVLDDFRILCENRQAG
ncbi:MAG TPA: Rieske 2Fe-2S domain-containing protein, partial [Alphaproteobacteria bacterium]|nr:Rieske 2Fe-2S domain-containing protein [Alphaproteobacteria bacterium]